jgi:hypothetical protein
MPRISPKTVNAVRVLLKKKKVFDFPTLLSFLNCSIRSGRLKLTQWQAHTSYNKSGQYYALPDVPRFDENGLWWFKGAYFSKYGTLKNTVVHLVGTSSAGLTGDQIGELVGLNPRSFLHHFRDTCNALFIRCLSVQEIVDELSLRNISISQSEVTFLGKKFIAYLAHAHREAQEEIRDAMQKRGGYILHVDGTCEGSSPNLFCGLDELSDLVLDSIKIPSEKKALLIPFFKRLKAQYGEPVALVHDMGKGILAAVEEVFPGVPDFICHFHFLRDTGKDLFGKEYKIVFDRLKKHGIRTALRERLKALEKKIGDDLHALSDFKADLDKGAFEISHIEQVPTIATYALIQWIFDASSSAAGYGFPFDCPHLAFYQRVKTAHGVLKQIMDILLRNRVKDNKPFYRLWHLLDKVVSDKKLAGAATSMEEKIPVLDELREALRIALPDGKDGLNDDGITDDISTIESAVKAFRQRVMSDDRLTANNDYLKMIAQIDKYWEKLFADPITVQTQRGPTKVIPQRTNNLLERFLHCRWFLNEE